MATYTYEQIYSDACKSIVRCESDASIAGRHDGADCVVVCDRKWGGCTPSVPIAYLNANADLTDVQTVTYYSGGYKQCFDGEGNGILIESGKTLTILQCHNGTNWVDWGTAPYRTVRVYRSNGGYMFCNDTTNICSLSAVKYTVS